MEITLVCHGLGGLPVPLEEPELQASCSLPDPKGPPPPPVEEEASQKEWEDDSSSEVSADENDFVPVSNSRPPQNLVHIEWDKLMNEVFSKMP